MDYEKMKIYEQQINGLLETFQSYEISVTELSVKIREILESSDLKHDEIQLMIQSVTKKIEEILDQKEKM